MDLEISQVVDQMIACKLHGNDLEEKEFLLLQELCGCRFDEDIFKMLVALTASGTILSIPVLCGLLANADRTEREKISMVILTIQQRVRARGSLLPEVYFTCQHWQQQWLGSTSAFLSYVQVIADNCIKQGYDENETDHIGQILAEEMGLDISPFKSFDDFKMCQPEWDYEADFQLVSEKMEEVKLLGELEEIGVRQSDLSFLVESFMDLQYDYLIARLKLRGDMEYYRFVFKMAECLNGESN